MLSFLTPKKKKTETVKKQNNSRKLLEVTDIFITLVVVIVSQVHAYVPNYRTVYTKYVSVTF